ncbi:unnamed protein product [Mucor fragilis]
MDAILYWAPKEKKKHATELMRTNQTPHLGCKLLMKKDTDLTSKETILKFAKKYLAALTKDTPPTEYNALKCIYHLYKVYTNIEEEKIHLYAANANKATYLHSLVCPTFFCLFHMDAPWIKFVWSESALKCKKDEENECF